MVVYVDNIAIKTEIIAENRFQLDAPRYPIWSPVPCLSLNDCFTSKLLSNSDRYMDKSVKSRDLIDLAVLRLQSQIPQLAIDKAENAYEIIRPLKKAIALFQKKPEYRKSCFEELQISEIWIPKIIDGIDLLCLDFGLEKTERTFKEQHDRLDDL
jgi:Nucleotidyl transferase AbiEii toxin, Type IV TA system